MYTEPNGEHSLWFEAALLPSGWAERVRLTLNRGFILSVDAAVEPLTTDERHAIGLPGIPNLHSHAFQRALAGLTERRAASSDFWSWRESMYRLANRLTPHQLETIAAFAFAEMLEMGITRAGEFHYIHHANNGAHYSNVAEHAERLASAAATTGIGLTLLPVFYAHGGVGGIEPAPAQRRFINTLDSYLSLFDASQRAIAPLATANLGIAAHSVRAVTPEELQTLASVQHGGPMHIHIAEQTGEVEEWLQFAGERPVEWLIDHLPVDERWCLVHATHVSAAEVSRLATSGATVGLCPITEANLGDGVFPAHEFIVAGGDFGIGTDSNVQIDAAAELRCLEYSQRLTCRQRNVLACGDGRSTGRTLFDCARLGGAKALRVRTGQLAPEFHADIVTLNTQHPSMAERTGDALIDSWIFSGVGAVDCVWAAGRQLVRDGRHRAHEEITRDYLKVLAALRD